MHPKDALEFIEFREKYGEAPLVLPTDVWRYGLRKPGERVDFELWGKPYSHRAGLGRRRARGHGPRGDAGSTTGPRSTPSRRRGPRRSRSAWPPGAGRGRRARSNGNIWRIGNPERGAGPGRRHRPQGRGDREPRGDEDGERHPRPLRRRRSPRSASGSTRSCTRASCSSCLRKRADRISLGAAALTPAPLPRRRGRGAGGEGRARLDAIQQKPSLVS